MGTEYSWYILAHQHVKKPDANSYSTILTGLKYKFAHKRFDKPKWNISDVGQRKRLIKLLKEIIEGRENNWRREIAPKKTTLGCKKTSSAFSKKRLIKTKKASSATP